MKNTVSVVCTRCNGSGNFSFNLIRGTVCFGCNGVGVIVTTHAKINAAKKAKEKRQEKEAADAEKRQAQIELYNQQLLNLFSLYKNDSRIGVQTKNKCEEFPAFAEQTYRTLEAVDSGKYNHSITFLGA